jgi:uncharacterized protein YndB with AHSA1/START domain
MADIPAVEIKRVYAAPRDKIFAAWTDPKKLSAWFKPSEQMSVEIQADVQVGGRYRFRITSPDGVQHISYGEYREIVPPKRLVFTWAWESGLVTDSLVTVSLRAVEGGTELTLRHERLATEDLRERHGKGWSGCLEQLEKFLAA